MYTCVTGVSLVVLRRPRDITLPASRRGTLYIYKVPLYRRGDARLMIFIC